MSNTSAAIAVAKGIAFLDGRSCCTDPCAFTDGAYGVVGTKWREKIDGDALDLGDSENCILGQLFGGYEKGLRRLGSKSYDWSRENGFESSTGITSRELTKAWKEALGLIVTPEPLALKVEQVIQHKDRSYLVFQLVRQIYVGGEYHWIVQSGELTDGVFVKFENQDLLLRKSSVLQSDYKDVSDKPKTGDFYKDKNGTVYFAESSESLWRMNATDGATRASKEYWEASVGTLTHVVTRSGRKVAEYIASGE